MGARSRRDGRSRTATGFDRPPGRAGGRRGRGASRVARTRWEYVVSPVTMAGMSIRGALRADQPGTCARYWASAGFTDAIVPAEGLAGHEVGVLDGLAAAGDDAAGDVQAGGRDAELGRRRSEQQRPRPAAGAPRDARVALHRPGASRSSPPRTTRSRTSLSQLDCAHLVERTGRAPRPRSGGPPSRSALPHLRPAVEQRAAASSGLIWMPGVRYRVGSGGPGTAPACSGETAPGLFDAAAVPAPASPATRAPPPFRNVRRESSPLGGAPSPRASSAPDRSCDRSSLRSLLRHGPPRRILNPLDDPRASRSGRRGRSSPPGSARQSAAWSSRAGRRPGSTCRSGSSRSAAPARRSTPAAAGAAWPGVAFAAARFREQGRQHLERRDRLAAHRGHRRHARRGSPCRRAAPNRHRTARDRSRSAGPCRCKLVVQHVEQRCVEARGHAGRSFLADADAETGGHHVTFSGALHAEGGMSRDRAEVLVRAVRLERVLERGRALGRHQLPCRCPCTVFAFPPYALAQT